MLVLQSKLVDFRTKECIGVICVNGSTSVPLSLGKAYESEVKDLDIIEYLSIDIEEVAVNSRRDGYFALLSKSIGVLDDLLELPYDRMGDICDRLSLKEVIYGNVFNYLDFMQLDNDIAIRRALMDYESCSSDR